MTCHNCGLPKGEKPGRDVQLTLRSDGHFRRERRVTVWCHDDECAIEAMAIARYGLDTSKWPITLAQFRATKPLDEQGSRRKAKKG